MRTPILLQYTYAASGHTNELDMASKTAHCGAPSCRKMWAAAFIMLAPVAGLLLWSVAGAYAWGLADGEQTVFTGCVLYDPSNTNAENPTDGEQTVFTGCVLLDQPKPLSRDAIYQGSATLAGLAIFGSLIGIRMGDALKKSSKFHRKIGAYMLVLGPYVLALTHIGFMWYPNPTHLSIVMPLSIMMIMVTVGGYVLVEQGRASAVDRHPPLR